MAITTTNVTLTDSNWTALDTGVNVGDELAATAEWAAFYAFGTAAPHPTVLGHARGPGEEFAAKYNASDKVWIRANSILPCRVTVSIKRSA